MGTGSNSPTGPEEPAGDGAGPGEGGDVSAPLPGNSDDGVSLQRLGTVVCGSCII